MAHGAIFGEGASAAWMDDERRQLAIRDWKAVLAHEDVVLHCGPRGQYSLHVRDVLVIAEDDLDDPRFVANQEDLGDPRIERTGLGFATVHFTRTVDVVSVARFLRSLQGERPLRVGPDHLLSPSQGGVLGPGSPPHSTRPGRGVLQRRQEMAAVDPSVRVAVIDSGLVAGPLADPMLAASRLATTSSAANPAPDPLWDGHQLRHWEGGHGTHVAGVLSAAAGGTASIIHYAVLDEALLPLPLVSDTAVAVAVAGAIKEGCRVLNLSLSGPVAADFDSIATSLVLGEAAGTAGRKRTQRDDDAVVVAAAGNERTSDPRYPAALSGVIGVGALDTRGRHRAKFSNFGRWVDCCAVGEKVFGPYVTGGGGPMLNDAHLPFKGWAYWSGTSFATPYVAGLIAAELAAGTSSARVAAASVLAAGVPMPGLEIGVKVG